MLRGQQARNKQNLTINCQLCPGNIILPISHRWKQLRNPIYQQTNFVTDHVPMTTPSPRPGLWVLPSESVSLCECVCIAKVHSWCRCRGIMYWGSLHFLYRLKINKINLPSYTQTKSEHNWQHLYLKPLAFVGTTLRTSPFIKYNQRHRVNGPAGGGKCTPIIQIVTIL